MRLVGGLGCCFQDPAGIYLAIWDKRECVPVYSISKKYFFAITFITTPAILAPAVTRQAHSALAGISGRMSAILLRVNARSWP